MAAFNIKRLATLPGVLEVSTLYITKNPTNVNLVDLTFVGNTVEDVRRGLGQADVDTAVETAVEAAIAGLTAEQIPDLPGSKITSPVASADKLTTGRKINDVAFDGTADITVPAVDTVTPRVAVSEVGVSVASLVDGKVPVNQLPNGLDNIDTYDTVAEFPAVGEIDVLYIARENNMMYRWSAGDPGEYIMIPAGGGASDTAVKLATPRQIALSGDATGSTMFDGSANVTIAVTMRALVEADIPDLPGTKITSPVASADKLTTARKITLSGDVTGEATFDGSGDITITTTGGAAPTGLTGVGIKTTFEDGIAKSAVALAAADIPDLPGEKITTPVALAKALDITAEW